MVAIGNLWQYSPLFWWIWFKIEVVISLKDGRYFIVTRKKIELCVINQSAETMKRGEKDIAKLLEQKTGKRGPEENSSIIQSSTRGNDPKQYDKKKKESELKPINKHLLLTYNFTFYEAFFLFEKSPSVDVLLCLMAGSVSGQVTSSMWEQEWCVKFKRHLTATLNQMKESKQAGVLSIGIAAFDKRCCR